MKKEATIKKTPIWTTNIHNEAFTKKNKLSLQHIISQSQNGNEIIVPFIVIINKKKDLTAQIGLVDPNIKLDREKLIKKETVSLLNKSNR
ncbi:hypothetical protein RV04_GL001233 [Enterococcus hermanniensis]|uniref:Uncharacterized protein n=1 Tax=Enterococcus hermanniensis TaxID=249189 RepID=A0A1L8TP56_9ENTE|nr:hypothetical protein RV04_GL001233 [Enterococcus hermanniensis]